MKDTQIVDSQIIYGIHGLNLVYSEDSDVPIINRKESTRVFRREKMSVL
ncbi:MAG: hypothetical protein J07HQW1_01456 [Haloquadratum walsbyi J07HQW1]|uniref:Uncharacterized protein n=1 Tax=Haloquadratum walsbyi J07HQW1 TaxID=1238424 RepID=U1PCX6_9EURY|nr:MAG: hypothetical protein J07HQW1_01456 [Haloquadratum walsbyi J07HQW1]